MKADVKSGDPRKLKLLKVNARFMRHEQFQVLVENIRRDGVLTSTPFVWYDKKTKTREVLSGNHRVKAAIEAGLTEINWLETDEPLEEAERIAIQLSHNAIAGEDDPSILQALYEELDDLELRAYSGLDDHTLELLEQVDVGNLKEPSLEFQHLSLMFLPSDARKVDDAFQQARELAGSADMRWLARIEDHVRLLDAIELSSKSYNIKNLSAALSYILDIFENHRDELAEGWYDKQSKGFKRRGDRKGHETWVPISTIVGVDTVPPQAAAVIKQAVDRMVGKDEVSPTAKWQAFELFAADYLAGD